MLSIAGEQVCAFDRLYTLGPDVLSHLRKQPFASANLLTRCVFPRQPPALHPPCPSPVPSAVGCSWMACTPHVRRAAPGWVGSPPAGGYYGPRHIMETSSREKNGCEEFDTRRFLFLQVLSKKHQARRFRVLTRFVTLVR